MSWWEIWQGFLPQDIPVERYSKHDEGTQLISSKVGLQQLDLPAPRQISGEIVPLQSSNPGHLPMIVDPVASP